MSMLFKTKQTNLKPWRVKQWHLLKKIGIHTEIVPLCRMNNEYIYYLRDIIDGFFNSVGISGPRDSKT